MHDCITVLIFIFANQISSQNVNRNQNFERIKFARVIFVTPIFAQFRDGSDQTGVLCAVSNVIEQIKCESKVDVFRAVKDVRELRMGAVGSFEEYKLCYTLIKEFIATSRFYENV